MHTPPRMGTVRGPALGCASRMPKKRAVLLPELLTDRPAMRRRRPTLLALERGARVIAAAPVQPRAKRKSARSNQTGTLKKLKKLKNIKKTKKKGKKPRAGAADLSAMPLVAVPASGAMVEGAFHRKGTATAATFRPWYWRY